MASSPWAVTKRKRESTPKSTPVSRKRLRRSDGFTNTSRKQQTLTQAQWTTASSLKIEDDTDVDPVTVEKSTTRRKLMSRESTLTQMDFFNQNLVQELDAELIQEVEFDGMPPPPMPQLDGHHESPRKLRKRKLSIHEDLKAPQRSPTSNKNPQTPSKKHVVQSSQSPESLPPSTRRVRLRSVDLCPTRSPLKERSPNVPNLAMFTSPNRREKVSNDSGRPSDHIAFTTLKLSKGHRLSSRRPAPRSHRVEDSQADVYSYPASSSSAGEMRSQLRQGRELHHPKLRSSDSPQQIEAKAEEAEIPETSQFKPLESSPPSIENEDPLLDITEMFEIPTKTPHKLTTRPSINLKTVIHDSEDDDFGSPIANDTQYNLYVDQRTSSPSQRTADISGKGPKVKDQTMDDQIDLEEAVANAATPTPRLVSSSRPQSKDGAENIEEETEDAGLPTIPQQQPFIKGSTTIQIPLNDMQQTPSSSAELSNRDTTQRSIRPLSMPHPSQISTQEGTQAYLGLSSMIHESAETQTQGTKPITIKESSSIRLPMNKIPAHEGSQLEGPDTGDLVSGNMDTEDDDDYDLDPPSSEPPAPVGLASKGASRRDEHQRTARDNSGSLIPPTRNEVEAVDEDVEASTADDLSGEDDCLDAEDPSDSASDRLQRQYSPIPGFNNDTQSNFTQNGHVTAAYIHRQRELGVLPKWFIPRPHRVPGYTGR